MQFDLPFRFMCATQCIDRAYLKPVQQIASRVLHLKALGPETEVESNLAWHNFFRLSAKNILFAVLRRGAIVVESYSLQLVSSR